MNKNSKNVSIISSLHRPYHSPLWVARWVCEYISMFCENIKTHDEYVKGFYFFFIYRLNALYDTCIVAQLEYISKETIEKVCDYFDAIEQYKRNEILDRIMHSKNRSDIEKNIYSTYKAATYAINLATEKLGFVENYRLTNAGKLLHLYKTPTNRMSPLNRHVYLGQILEKDFFFFVPLCLLIQKQKTYHNLKELIFAYIKRYHPVSRFDYTSTSSGNYVRVRVLWIKQLLVLTNKYNISSVLKNNILKTNLQDEYQLIQSELKEFLKIVLDSQKKKDKYDSFLSIYKKMVDKTDGSGFVNLYDIMKELRLI